MAKKKIIIIGAGISGLSAGIHALLKGFDVEIYESNAMAGGQCTAWHRKGYEIDGCIHWLTGSKSGTSLHSIWEACGALSPDTEIINHEHIASYMDEQSNIHYLYSDIYKMEKELLRISPEDEKEIKHLIRLIRAFQGILPPHEKPEEMMTIWDKLKFVFPILPKGKEIKFAMNVSVTEYVKRFKSLIIQNLLLACTPDVIALNAMIFMLALRSGGDGGWAQGGSLKFSKRMHQRFEKLGGKLFLKSKVENILMENNKAVGIELIGEKEIRTADYIVPAIDVHALLHGILKGKYIIPYFEERFADSQKYPVISATLISIGVEINLSHRPQSLSFKPENKIVIGNVEFPVVTLNHYAYDNSLSPQGHTLVEFLFSDFNYDYWDKLRKYSKEAYTAEKNRVGGLLLAELQRVLPETSGKAQVLDIATPLTYKKYCNAYKGAYMSFLSTAGIKQESYKTTIDGIENLYVAGQWVMPDGGLPCALLSGKFAVQRICKQEGISIKFNLERTKHLYKIIKTDTLS